MSSPEIAELKALVDIPRAWAALGLPDPPRRTGLVRSPFREDRKASFSICHGGRGYRDHATGESGDVVGFVARARGCSVGEAIRVLADIAGTPPPGRRASKPSETPPHKWPHELRRPTLSELFRLQELRGLPVIAGLEALILRGILWTGTAHDAGQDVEAWILQDGRQSHARRLDGQPWRWCNAKSWTKAGSDLAAPLGIADATHREAVALVEGGPDLIAAASIAFLELDGDLIRLGLCASMSASQKPTPLALATLRGKAVRLIPQTDDASIRWARAWANALEGAAVDWVNLKPLHVKDLCELAPRFGEAWTPPDDQADGHALPDEFSVFKNLIR